MEIYDISQEVFGCNVYPGDPSPKREKLSTILGDGVCNLSAFSMCAHNGTHVDAPFHFYKDGKGIDKVDLEKFIGPAYVEGHEGDVTAEDAREILKRAKASYPGADKRILIKGDATLTLEAAEIFASEHIDLYGNESQTVGPMTAPKPCHYAMLKEEIVLLEGIRLADVPDGAYFLNCAPINLTDTDGSPCRALLFDIDKETGTVKI